MAFNLKSGNGPLLFKHMGIEKKSGFGPMEIKEDDQSREAQTIKYEQGNPLGIENPVALEKLYEKTEISRQ
jgi:hypothetical protein